MIRWPLQASVSTRITISHSDIINAFLENVNKRGDLSKDMNLIRKCFLLFDNHCVKLELPGKGIKGF